MAFIRWKKNRQGMPRAYLVRAFRDETGKPRQVTLAYLGTAKELSPEHIAQLREKYKDLSIDWETVKPAAEPKRTLDVAALSNEELLRQLKTLRIEKGLSINALVQAILDAGLPPWKTSDGERVLSPFLYQKLEEEGAKGPLNYFLAKVAPDVLPYLRKVLA
jgi:hypothetical protein